MADLTNPSVDLDRQTGETIVGWAHVLQSLDDIFTMRFGELIMSEWYGSIVSALLGENMNAETIVRFFAAVSAAIEQWEPRFRVRQIVPLSVNRDGHFWFRIEGEYRPRALLGDFTVEGARRVYVGANDGSTTTTDREPA